jgi:hypothetical protein
MKFNIVFLSCLMFSCTNKKQLQESNSTQIDSLQISISKIKDSTNTSETKDSTSIIDKKDSLRVEIINNNFANAPFGVFEFKEKNLSKCFKEKYDIQNSTIKNKYSEDIDTLIYFKGKKSIVKFYKTREKIFLDSMNVSEKNFILIKGGLDIGMNKKDFLNYFKCSQLKYSDSISVINDEGNNAINFIFLKDKINKITILPW